MCAQPRTGQWAWRGGGHTEEGGVIFAYRRGLLLKGRGLCISSRRRANGRGWGGELKREGRSSAPGTESSRERSRLPSVHPAPTPGPHPRPASDGAAAAAARAAAALGDPGPAGAAGGGGARALDVPQRGGQSEKGGRRGLGWGAAPLLMWRRVGGGRGTRMERVPRLERVVLGGGVQEYAPLQAKSWETEVWGTGPLLPRF